MDMKISEKKLRKIICEAVQGAMAGGNAEIPQGGHSETDESLAELLDWLINDAMQRLSDWVFMTPEYTPEDEKLVEDLGINRVYGELYDLAENLEDYLGSKGYDFNDDYEQ